MNKKQLFVMWLGIAIIVGMGIYPPYMTSRENYGAYYPQSYKFICSNTGRYGHENMINVPQLFAQWFIVAVVTAGLLVTFKDKKKDKEK